MSHGSCASLLFLITLSVCIFHNADTAKTSRKLPKFVKRCHRNDPIEDLKRCLHANIAIFQPRLGAGIPEMKISGLDPLYLDSVVMNAPNILFEFKNVTIFGASNFDVLSGDIDVNKSRIFMEVSFPSIYMTSNYAVKGRLLVLQLDSNGVSTGNYSDIYARIELNGKERMTAKGQTFLDFNDDSTNSVELKLKGKPKMHFTNLFVNNEELSRATHLVIDDNIEEIVEELMPVVNRIISTFVFNVIKQIFNTFAVEDLFLD